MTTQLNPVDHPAGTRVLCKLHPESTRVYDARVLSWGRDGTAAHLQIADDAPYRTAPGMALVVEVLERPGQEQPGVMPTPDSMPERGAHPLDRKLGRQGAQDGDTAPGGRAAANQPQASPPAPPRDPALIERARAFLRESNWAPYASSVPTAHFYADFASSEVAARDKEIDRLTKYADHLRSVAIQHAEECVKAQDEAVRAHDDAIDEAAKVAQEAGDQSSIDGWASDAYNSWRLAGRIRALLRAEDKQAGLPLNDVDREDLAVLARGEPTPAAPPREERDVSSLFEWAKEIPGTADGKMLVWNAWKAAERIRARFGPAIEALEQIRDWKLPPAEFKGKPCSFESAWGSNGARDYMRRLACAALDKMRESARRAAEKVGGQ